MTKLLRTFLTLFFLAGFFVAPAMTQNASPPTAEIKIDKRKLLVQPRNADGSLVMVSFWEDPVLWVREQQQEFYGSISGSLRRIKSSSAATAAWTLMFLSFGYGIFHAAGPGHGKTVVSAWLLATENELKRGILIAFLSSIIQALTAILLVSGLLLVVGSAASAARDMAGVLESASYAMIAAMGLYLIWTALRPHTEHGAHPTTIMCMMSIAAMPTRLKPNRCGAIGLSPRLFPCLLPWASGLAPAQFWYLSSPTHWASTGQVSSRPWSWRWARFSPFQSLLQLPSIPRNSP